MSKGLYGKFSIEGDPRPQPRPRCMGRGGKVWAFNAESDGLREWKRSVKHGAQGLGFRFGPEPRVAVKIVLYVRHKRRSDLDNYAKSILDALTSAGLWNDDSQVDRLEVRRLWVADGLQGADIYVSDLQPEIWLQDAGNSEQEKHD